MPRKSELSKSEIEHVRRKLAGMCRYRRQAEVAKRLGIHAATVSNLLSGKTTPSRQMADLILGVKREAKHAPCPHCNGTGRLPVDTEGLQPGVGPGGGVRDEPVQAQGSDVLRIPRQGDVGDQLPMEPPGERVVRLPKSRVRELELQNKARRAAGLPSLHVKVVHCAGTCGRLIESLDHRMCVACRSNEAPRLSGEEVFP